METLHDIWAELGGRVRRFVGHRVNDPATAEDIAQDVMLKVQSQLHDLPSDDKLPAWVFTVARNAIIDHYRAAPSATTPTSIISSRWWTRQPPSSRTRSAT